MQSLQKILSQIWHLFRAEENTKYVGLTVYDVAVRVIFFSLFFTLVSLPMLRLYDAITLGILLALSAMTASESLGARREIYDFGKTKQMFARILAPFFLLFTLLILVGAFGSRNVNSSGQLLLLFLCSVLSITILINAVRRRIDKTGNTK